MNKKESSLMKNGHSLRHLKFHGPSDAAGMNDRRVCRSVYVNQMILADSTAFFSMPDSAFYQR